LTKETTYIHVSAKFMIELMWLVLCYLMFNVVWSRTLDVRKQYSDIFRAVKGEGEFSKNEG
jgi:hypothetical protein